MAAPARLEAPFPTPPAAARPLRILLCDPSGARRALLTRLLRASGWDDATVIESHGAAEALALARRDPPDAVLVAEDEQSLVEALGQQPKPPLVVGYGPRLAARPADRWVSPLTLLAPDALREALAPLSNPGRLVAPCADSVARLFGERLGRACAVEPRCDSVFAGEGSVLFASYGTGREAEALAACDLRLAAFAGAAAAGRPIEDALGCLESGRLTPAITRAVWELLEAGKALFAGEGEPPPPLLWLHTRLDELPTGLLRLAVRPRTQAAFSVSVLRYGHGALSVCLR